MAIPTSGLITRLTGETVIGTTLKDQLGNNDFTMYGEPVIGPGLRDLAVYMDGVNDELRHPGSNMLVSSFTIAALIQLVPGDVFQWVQGQDGVGAGWSISLTCSESNIAFSVITGSPIASRNCSYNFPGAITGKPLFVAFRYQSGGQIDISYNEFRSVASTSFSGTGLRASTFGIYMGRSHNTTNYFKSMFDEVLFYDRSVTDSELDDILLTMSGYEVAGTITQDGTPLSTEVRIYRASDGELLRTVTSDAAGNYSQIIITPDPVYVMAVPQNGYRPLVHGPVDPTLQDV